MAVDKQAAEQQAAAWRCTVALTNGLSEERPFHQHKKAYLHRAQEPSSVPVRCFRTFCAICNSPSAIVARRKLSDIIARYEDTTISLYRCVLLHSFSSSDVCVPVAEGGGGGGCMSNAEVAAVARRLLTRSPWKLRKPDARLQPRVWFFTGSGLCE